MDHHHTTNEPGQHGGEPPPAVRYQEIAEDLRQKIASGEYPPGSKIPTYTQLTAKYQASSTTVREAVNLLRVEGLVRSAQRHGTIVLDRGSGVVRLDRGGSVRRNEYGYVFNAGAGHWAPLSIRPPEWATADAETAARLEIEEGAPVLVRWRTVGPDHNHPLQLTRTCLTEELARDTVIEHPDTGPGGWMDRAEHDLGHGPLSWAEYTSSRMPSREEARALRMAKQTPALVLARVATSGTTRRPVGVDITVMSGALFEVGHAISRDRTARWPTIPATDRNTPR